MLHIVTTCLLFCMCHYTVKWRQLIIRVVCWRWNIVLNVICPANSRCHFVGNTITENRKRPFSRYVYCYTVLFLSLVDVILVEKITTVCHRHLNCSYHKKFGERSEPEKNGPLLKYNIKFNKKYCSFFLLFWQNHEKKYFWPFH